MSNIENVKFVYCYFGDGIALGAYGSHQDLEQTFNCLYNNQGHNDEQRYLSDTFGYVLTSKPQLKRGIANAFIVSKNSDWHKSGVSRQERKSHRNQEWAEALEYAEKLMARMELENFLETGTPLCEYKLPTGCF